MGEHKSGEVYGKIKIAFMRNGGLPSRICYDRDFKRKLMGCGEAAIAELFLTGLHNLCDTCRTAIREMRLATETAEKCPRRNPNGLCKDNSHPCSMKCQRIADAINAYRTEVNNGAKYPNG